MKISGFKLGISLFCFAAMCVPPRPDINMTWYAVSSVSLGILGIISMHFAFEEDK